MSKYQANLAPNKETRDGWVCLTAIPDLKQKCSGTNECLHFVTHEEERLG